MIQRTDGASLTVIAREGQVLRTVPGHNGTPVPVLLGEFDNRLTLAFNNAGLAEFRTADHGAIFLGDGGPLVSIAEAGQAAPGGGRFAGFEMPSLNDAGQVAFKASVEGTGGTADNTGLFFFDDRFGVLEIARRGSEFLGDRIAWVDLYGSYDGLGADQALNDRGQVAYSFWLTDGRMGVAVWTVPEPSAAGLLLVASINLLRRRRGRPEI